MNKRMTSEELKNLIKNQIDKLGFSKAGIKRYKIVDGVLVEDAAGDIVKFIDHSIEVGELRKSKSYTADSTPEVSWRMQELPVDSSYDSNQSRQEYSWRL